MDVQKIQEALGKTAAIDERGRSCYTEDVDKCYAFAKELEIDRFIGGPGDTVYFQFGSQREHKDWRVYTSASDFLKKHMILSVV
jgi:hypothetical protein